jgi:hypothetical protein
MLYMLSPDATQSTLLAFAVHDCDAEDAFGEENAFSVMTECGWRKSVKKHLDSSNQL